MKFKVVARVSQIGRAQIVFDLLQEISAEPGHFREIAGCFPTATAAMDFARLYEKPSTSIVFEV